MFFALGDTPNMTELNLEQPALADSVLSRDVGLDDIENFLPCDSVTVHKVKLLKCDTEANLIQEVVEAYSPYI